MKKLSRFVTGVVGEAGCALSGLATGAVVACVGVGGILIATYYGAKLGYRAAHRKMEN